MAVAYRTANSTCRYFYTYEISSYEISQTRNSIKLKTLKKQNFESCAEFFLARMRVPRDEIGGRVLLGDNSEGMVVRLRPITFQ
jgi:hypothetical protein